MGFPFCGLTREQWEDLQEALGTDLGPYVPPIIRGKDTFDLEEQSDEEWSDFLSDVEDKLNERIDAELEKEAEDEQRVTDLKETVTLKEEEEENEVCNS